MNGKYSVATVGVVGIGALALGLLVPGARLFAKRHKEAVIQAVTLLPDGTYSCQQYSDGDKDAFPHLDRPTILPPFLGHTVAWRGQGTDGKPATVVVHFSKTPFAKDQYNDGEESSTVGSAASGDYAFDKVKVGGTECSKFIDPGVHVDR